jgi:hypothetical protein
MNDPKAWTENPWMEVIASRPDVLAAIAKSIDDLKPAFNKPFDNL